MTKPLNGKLNKNLEELLLGRKNKNPQTLMFPDANETRALWKKKKRTKDCLENGAKSWQLSEE